jgi:hypothetical protein
LRKVVELIRNGTPLLSLSLSSSRKRNTETEEEVKGLNPLPKNPISSA